MFLLFNRVGSKLAYITVVLLLSQGSNALAESGEQTEEPLIMEAIGGENAGGQEEPRVAANEDEDADEAGEAPLKTKDVVITGTRQEKEAKDAPVRTQKVDREAMEQQNARNVAEALDYTTGLRVESNCQNCGFTQLRLNGLGGSYTQVLIDGMPSFSGLASVYGLEQIPTALLDRIEVVKGGGSALYGPSAVAGVVNLITRRPTENSFGIESSYESMGLEAPDLRLSADGSFVSDDGRVAANLFFGSRRRDEIDLNGDGFSEVTRLKQYSAGSNLFFDPFKGGELRVSLHTIQEYRRGGDQLDLPSHEVAVSEELSTDRYHADLRWSHALSDAIDYRIAYVFAYTERESYYGGGGDVEPTLPDAGTPVGQGFRDDFEQERLALGGYGRTTNPHHVGDAHLNIAYDAAGPQVVTVGAQASVDGIDDRYVVYDRKIEDVYSDVGAYLQHNWIFADWGESVLGARLDKHSELDAPIVSPRAALRISPARFLRFRSAFSTGFRAPAAFDEDLHVETVGGAARLIVNDEKLEAERSMSLAQQVETSFELAGGEELRFGVNGYWTRLDQAFVLNAQDNPATPELELVRSNRGTTTVLGAELEAGIEAPDYALRAGWTVEMAENEEADEDFGDTRIYRTPQSYGYLDALLKVGDFQAQSGVMLTGPMLVPHYDANGDPLQVATSPWFVNWSLNVSYAAVVMDSTLLEPYLGVRNILDSRQKDLDSGADRDSAYVYGPSQPRTVFAGMRARF